MIHITEIQQVLAVISGLVVGFSLGLIGGGGSILAVPLLLYVVGIHNPHLVIGSTALAVAVNAYLNLIPHWRSGNVQWPPAIAFAIPGAIGAFVGSSMGKMVNGKSLLFLFGILMILVAIMMLKPQTRVGRIHFRWTNRMFLRVVLSGLTVGAVSGFFWYWGRIFNRTWSYHIDGHAPNLCYWQFVGFRGDIWLDNCGQLCVFRFSALDHRCGVRHRGRNRRRFRCAPGESVR